MMQMQMQMMQQMMQQMMTMQHLRDAQSPPETVRRRKMQEPEQVSGPEQVLPLLRRLRDAQSGLEGSNVMLLKRHDVKVIVEMMMGFDRRRRRFFRCSAA